jgi:hypothetical protein
MPDDLTILLTNCTLASRTGTEIVIRDLSLALREAGHSPIVYSPSLGAVADDIRQAGIPVVDNLADLPRTPDVIHGHHYVETVLALLRFPNVPAIFVCHDRCAPTDVPPLFPRIQRYVAVDYNCRERLVEDYRIPEKQVSVIFNAVDLDRFQLRPPLPACPSRAVVFSNYAGACTHLDAIREACGSIGLPLDVIGAQSDRCQPHPETILGQYDIVFAKARCALEAMATGCAVVLCDTRGLGGLVTPRNFDEMRWWNFGMRVLQWPLEADKIRTEIGRYDAMEARQVRDLVCMNAGLRDAVTQYICIYQEAISEQALAVGDEMRGYLERTAAGYAQLESLLRADSMPALSGNIFGQMRIVCSSAPGSVEAGGNFTVTVELDNPTEERLASAPPFPVHVSYRWIPAGSGEPMPEEGKRTPLRIPLAPGGHCIQPAKIEAPSREGRYGLRVTLVQEGVRWLDHVAGPARADVCVDVVTPAAESS